MNNNEDILNKVKEIIHEIVDIENDAIVLDANLRDDLKADSLASVATELSIEAVILSTESLAATAAFWASPSNFGDRGHKCCALVFDHSALEDRLHQPRSPLAPAFPSTPSGRGFPRLRDDWRAGGDARYAQ